jgi:phage protein D
MAQQKATPLGLDGSETFYVPAFEIRVGGTPVPRDIMRDVIDVTYQDSLEQIDSFTLTVNNWDAITQQPKYVGADVDAHPEARQFARSLDPGQHVALYMGYQTKPDSLRLMMTGIITTLEPDFPEAGAPKLTVRGLDILDEFRKNKFTWAWDSARDSDIAEEMQRQPGQLGGHPGLGVPVKVDAAARAAESEEYVMMHDQYPIVFLLGRAHRLGYDLVVEYDSKGKPSLRFGPSKNVNLESYRLEWGRSLLSFRPTFTTTNQISQVTVCGWDRRTKRPIQETVKMDDCAPGLNADLREVVRAVNRQEVITDWPVHTRQEARQRGRSFLMNRLQNIVRADGATVGLPLLRAGVRAEIQKVGTAFSGNYFVTETTHTINDSGYRTTFKARREQER